MNECTRGLLIVRLAVLIDTWWNVNLGDYSIDTFYNGVLIDTWWNVNQDALVNFDGYANVLIDTWWNVNTFISLADTVLQPF